MIGHDDKFTSGTIGMPDLFIFKKDKVEDKDSTTNEKDISDIKWSREIKKTKRNEIYGSSIVNPINNIA